MNEQFHLIWQVAYYLHLLVFGSKSKYTKEIALLFPLPGKKDLWLV